MSATQGPDPLSKSMVLSLLAALYQNGNFSTFRIKGAVYNPQGHIICGVRSITGRHIKCMYGIGRSIGNAPTLRMKVFILGLVETF